MPKTKIELIVERDKLRRGIQAGESAIEWFSIEFPDGLRAEGAEKRVAELKRELANIEQELSKHP